METGTDGERVSRLRGRLHYPGEFKGYENVPDHSCLGTYGNNCSHTGGVVTVPEQVYDRNTAPTRREKIKIWRELKQLRKTTKDPSALGQLDWEFYCRRRGRIDAAKALTVFVPLYSATLGGIVFLGWMFYKGLTK